MLGTLPSSLALSGFAVHRHKWPVVLIDRVYGGIYICSYGAGGSALSWRVTAPAEQQQVGNAAEEVDTGAECGRSITTHLSAAIFVLCMLFLYLLLLVLGVSRRNRTSLVAGVGGARNRAGFP